MNLHEGFSRISVLIGRVATLLFLYSGILQIYNDPSPTWEWTNPAFQGYLLLLLCVALSWVWGRFVRFVCNLFFEQVIWVWEGFSGSRTI